MKVAYLINQYPKISHTFIRREIEALEREGVVVVRHSIRRSGDRLELAADREEAEKTKVLLDRGVVGFLGAVLGLLVRRPLRFFKALMLALRIGRRSDRGFLLNLVYLAEACVFLGSVERHGVRHVHAHFGTNSAAVAMLCRELGGPTYSFTIHGPEEFDRPDLLHLREKIERSAFVVTVSSFGRSQAFRYCGHHHWPKVEIVPCGVDSGFLDLEPTPVPAAPKLASVGRLSEQKGQLLLIDALGELHKRGRDFEMSLVGDGELRGAVEAAIKKHGLGTKVKLLGWGDEEVVRRTVSEARALILPSFAEGLPVVIMEALALGRPVVSTYVAGIPELVEPGKNGWLVPAGSVEHLVTAMEEVLASSSEHLDALGREGRGRVRERHNVTKIGPRMRALLDRWS